MRDDLDYARHASRAATVCASPSCVEVLSHRPCIIAARASLAACQPLRPPLIRVRHRQDADVLACHTSWSHHYPYPLRTTILPRIWRMSQPAIIRDDTLSHVEDQCGTNDIRGTLSVADLPRCTTQRVPSTSTRCHVRCEDFTHTREELDNLHWPSVLARRASWDWQRPRLQRARSRRAVIPLMTGYCRRSHAHRLASTPACAEDAGFLPGQQYPRRRQIGSRSDGMQNVQASLHSYYARHIPISCMFLFYVSESIESKTVPLRLLFPKQKKVL